MAACWSRERARVVGGPLAECPRWCSRDVRDRRRHVCRNALCGTPRGEQHVCDRPRPAAGCVVAEFIGAELVNVETAIDRDLDRAQLVRLRERRGPGDDVVSSGVSLAHDEAIELGVDSRHGVGLLEERVRRLVWRGQEDDALDSPSESRDDSRRGRG